MTQEEAYEVLSQGLNLAKMTISGDSEYIFKYFTAEVVAIKALKTAIENRVEGTEEDVKELGTNNDE